MYFMEEEKKDFPADYSLPVFALEILPHRTCAQRNANTLIIMRLIKHYSGKSLMHLPPPLTVPE